jgi:sugar (pentulose or hexulose) kinase
LQKKAAAAAAAVAAVVDPAAASSRANALPLLAPAPSPKMNTQQLSQYQEDLKLYRELRADLAVRVRHELQIARAT